MWRNWWLKVLQLASVKSWNIYWLNDRCTSWIFRHINADVDADIRAQDRIYIWKQREISFITRSIIFFQPIIIDSRGAMRGRHNFHTKQILLWFTCRVVLRRLCRLDKTEFRRRFQPTWRQDGITNNKTNERSQSWQMQETPVLHLPYACRKTFVKPNWNMAAYHPTIFNCSFCRNELQPCRQWRVMYQPSYRAKRRNSPLP